MFNIGMPKGEMKIVVPDSVKGKWSAVKLVVEDKTSKKTQEFTVKLNSELKIPNSDLKVVVGEFLPDFKMSPDQITSSSNMQNNPAVAIKVFESGKQIFPSAGKKWGWLYAKPELRNVHPFEHPKFSLSLEEGIKKG